MRRRGYYDRQQSADYCAGGSKPIAAGLRTGKSAGWGPQAINMTWQQEALLVLRVVIAAVLGGVLGWQREHEGREAGVPTFAAVSLGACLLG